MTAVEPEDDGLKSFTFRRRNRETDPVVPFKLEGVTFHLHPQRVNGFVALDLGTIRISQDSKPMWEFLEGLLGDEFDRFRTIVRDPDLELDADDFKDLIGWMMEQVAEHPTERSSS